MGRVYETIDYPDGSVILIGRLPRSRFGPLEALLDQLQQRWLKWGRYTQLVVQDDASWDIIKRIGNLFPRYDIPGQWGFDLEPLRSDIAQIESLFLFQLHGDDYDACRLVAMHQFEPIPREPWQEEEAADTAAPSSGDANMDMLSSLAVGFERFSEAWLAWETLDMESLDRFLYRINELRRDPEERREEILAEDFAAWKDENQDTYREALGIKYQIPKDS